MPSMRLPLIALLCMVHWLLLACGSMTIKDTTTQTYIPIQGWHLELHKPVVIPAGRARVFFQEGRRVYAVNEYLPHCQLIVRDISDQPQDVQPGRFVIDRAFGSTDEFVSNDRILLATAGETVIADGGGGGGERFLIFLYHMKLHDDMQPHVTYLVCGGAAKEPFLARYPTLQDIHVSLGEYATLIRPGED